MMSPWISLWPLVVGSIVAWFLVGSIPFGLLIARGFYGVDLRTSGSGNIGAANALRSLGRVGGAAVFVLDVLKGTLPVVAVEMFLIPYPPFAIVCGLAAVAGHCFSPWLGWRGGKGVATNLGVVIPFSPAAAFVFVLVWAAVALTSRYSSLGSIAATVVMSVILASYLGLPGAVYGTISAVLIIILHRENIARLRAGNERRLSFGSKRVGGSEDESRRQAS